MYLVIPQKSKKSYLCHKEFNSIFFIDFCKLLRLLGSDYIILKVDDIVTFNRFFPSILISTIKIHRSSKHP